MTKYTPIFLIITYTMVVYVIVILVGKKGGGGGGGGGDKKNVGCYTGCDKDKLDEFIKYNSCTPICNKDKQWECPPKCENNQTYDYDYCKCVDCPLERKCTDTCCVDGQVCVANRCVKKCKDGENLCGVNSCCSVKDEVCEIVNNNFQCIKKNRICKDGNTCVNQDCCGDKCCETVGKYCQDGECVYCKDEKGNIVKCGANQFCMTDELRKVSGSTFYGCVDSPSFTGDINYNPKDTGICTKDYKDSPPPSNYTYPDNYCYSTTSSDKPDDFIRIKFMDSYNINNIEQCAKLLYEKGKTTKIIYNKKQCIAHEKCNIPVCSDSINCPIKDPSKCGPDGAICDINYFEYDKDTKLCKNTV